MTLVTKLHPPQPRPGHVVRPRLLSRLDEGANRKLTVLAAPAGFGKTTLLAQWATSLSRPLAWLTLDPGDADPVAFWKLVGEALDVARARSNSSGLAAGPRVVLVLDDYDRVADARVHESVREFVEEAHPNVQIVLSGRVDPPFPLGAIRARGELVELRAPELRLTAEEGAAVVERTAGPDYDDATAASLVERCEGWPAGVYLTAASAATPSLGDTHIAEFLFGDALEGQSEEVLAFLLHASVLERLSGSVCDAVLERTGSGALLAQLEHENLFVLRLDERGEWYRLHGALARTLVTELARREPALVPALHRRAAAWYRRARVTDAAIEHALSAGAWGEAVRPIARSWVDDVHAGERGESMGRLARVPDEVLEREPRLALVRSWLLFLDGRPGEAEASLSRAATAAAGRSPRVRAIVERETCLVRASFVYGDVAATLESARRSYEVEQSTRGRAVAAWALGSALWWAAALEESAGLLREAVDLARTDQRLVTCAATSLLARIALSRGDGAEAERLAGRAQAIVSEHCLDRLPELGMVATALGAALAARGQHAEAEPVLERGLRLRRAWGYPLETADALIASAPTSAALGHRALAASLLTEARAVLATCADPGALPERLAAAERDALPRPDRSTAMRPDLSERELAVLRLLAAGFSKREAGAELYLSFNTIHTHTKSIYRKLRVSTRREAVARARELRLV